MFHVDHFYLLTVSIFMYNFNIMKPNLKLIEKELKKYFYYLPCINIEGDDMYMCRCGQTTIVDPSLITYLVDDDMGNFSDSDNLDNLFSNKRIINSICTHCNSNLASKENSAYVQNLNIYFFERFIVNETDEFLQLSRIKSGVFYDLESRISSKKSEYAYIKINKKTQKVYVKTMDNAKHIQIHLDDVFKYIVNFFQKNNTITYSDGYIDVHDWIGRLAQLIRDSKNMNVVNELLSLMVGKAGFDILSKIAVIFLSIIIYPSLSTISLTKGNIFLFDLLANCPIPDKKYLQKHKATSPLKIFNTLVALKNKKLQKDLDSDDNNKLEYVHTSNATNDLITKIKSENIDIDSNTSYYKKGKGKIFFRDVIKKSRITPFWFSKLNNFSDYEKSIEWLRIIKYEQFIELLEKYPMVFLLNAYKTLEFREDLNFDRIKQFLNLMLDYCKNALELETVEQIVNYAPVLQFEFNLYDDCYRMIEELKWSPNKVLFKIKTMKSLYELHENLLKQRSYINNNEINLRFIEFSEKFKFLETYSKNLDVHLDIKLIQTPESLMNYAVSMHNCAGSYVRRVANGEYLTFIVSDKSPQRTKEEYAQYMMVLEITTLGLEFVGIKSKFNKYGSNRFKEDVKKYLVDKDINFKDVPSIKTNTQSNEVTYNGFFEKIIKD